MFAFCTPEQSDAIHQEILGIEEEIFQGLGLPYHVIDTCTGDLGGPAYRKYDLEAWMPGRGEDGEYGEVTSTSNCTDFQARRLNIRYKSPKQKGTRFVHTLNGTAVAVTPGPGRDPGELPAGRRQRGHSRSAAQVDSGKDRITRRRIGLNLIYRFALAVSSKRHVPARNLGTLNKESEVPPNPPPSHSHNLLQLPTTLSRSRTYRRPGAGRAFWEHLRPLHPLPNLPARGPSNGV